MSDSPSNRPDVFSLHARDEKLVVAITTNKQLSVVQTLLWRAMRAACVAADLTPTIISVEIDERGNVIGTAGASYREWSLDPATEERLCVMTEVVEAALEAFGFQRDELDEQQR